MTNREHRLFYGVADTLDCESALAALKDQAMDLSEYMAIAMLEYAMEGEERECVTATEERETQPSDLPKGT